MWLDVMWQCYEANATVCDKQTRPMCWSVCVFVQANLSEIHSNMWVRNGLQIKGQAMTYVQSHFCNSMIDPDIYLLQVTCWHSCSLTQHFCTEICVHPGSKKSNFIFIIWHVMQLFWQLFHHAVILAVKSIGSPNYLLLLPLCSYVKAILPFLICFIELSLTASKLRLIFFRQHDCVSHISICMA